MTAAKVRQVPRRSGLLVSPRRSLRTRGPGEHTMDGEHDAELEAADAAMSEEFAGSEVVDQLPIPY